MNQNLPGRSLDEWDQNVLYDCLGHSTRQSILRLLQNQDAPLHLADLARDLAARERKETGDATDPLKLYTELYHCHVPKLVDADLADYNEERRTVTATAAPSHREMADL